MKNNNKRNLIIKAAERRFSKLGYYATTIEEIAKDLRVAKGGIFYYFKTKEDLYFEIVIRQKDKFINEIINITNLQTLLNFFLHQSFNPNEEFNIFITTLINYNLDKTNERENEIIEKFIVELKNHISQFFNNKKDELEILFIEHTLQSLLLPNNLLKQTLKDESQIILFQKYFENIFSH
jgi:AcrR family transcriptional regulator